MISARVQSPSQQEDSRLVLQLNLFSIYKHDDVQFFLFFFGSVNDLCEGPTLVRAGQFLLTLFLFTLFSVSRVDDFSLFPGIFLV